MMEQTINYKFINGRTAGKTYTQCIAIKKELQNGKVVFLAASDKNNIAKYKFIFKLLFIKVEFTPLHLDRIDIIELDGKNESVKVAVLQGYKLSLK